MAERCILHVDMDAFYASVEQRDRPELRGRPVAVGGASRRGVVAAASYEARRYGVRSAMPMAEALRRCPELECVRPRMQVYRDVSRQVFRIFREVTPVVEGLSLDEAFLDVSACLRLLGSGAEIAAAIKVRIRNATELSASVGVAGSKLVAKIASDLNKPDGLVIVTPATLRATLDPLPVAVIPGIGRKTLARLEALGIHTVRDLRCAPESRLRPVFGRYARRQQERAAGIDPRPVVPERDDKSISAESTFNTDLCEPREMERELMRLCERTAGRLRRAAVAAGSVQLKIRQADFTTVTRQQTLTPPGNATDILYSVARQLLAVWLADNPGARVRLLGVGGSKLMPDTQADLFAGIAEAAPVDRAVDAVRERFGDTALRRGSTLRPHDD